MSYKIENEELYIGNKINELLALKEVPTGFSEDTYIDENNDYSVLASDINRKDLTQIDCFTIDGPDAKELDDAVSLSVNEDGFDLGVHIADVTAYVPAGSRLSKEALNRGTTVYLPGRSVPMLPAYISEKNCSLTAGTDKRAVSMIIHFDSDGNIKSYEVCRSWIRSRVRGIYSEVNSIIEGVADESVQEKYAGLTEEIKSMYALSLILRKKRAQNGADVKSHGEYKYRFNNGTLVLSLTGDSNAERMICEFMVAANTCMSYYFGENNLPGMYRTQKNSSLSARYNTKSYSHESLAICGGYMRFTSPIRRATDYCNHMVLSDYLDGTSSDIISAKYIDEFSAFCGKAQSLEDRAKNIERTILKECHMLYFSRHSDDTYKGIIVGKSRHSEDSIVSLQPYNIRILGTSMLSKYIGQEFLIRVMVDEQSKVLRIGHISRIAA